MKTKLFFLILALIINITTIFAQLPPYVPTGGLVAWYALNGSGNDLGPNTKHGTLVNTAPTQNRYSSNNEATYFYGSSEIDCGNDPVFNLDDCTFSAWVNVSKTNLQYQCILAKFDSMPGSYSFYLIGNKVGIEYTINLNAVKNIVSPMALNANTWYHVVATHDANTGIKLYVNGSLKASDPLAFNINPGVDHFRIGSQGPAFPIPMHAGRLDDIGVWNRALTQSEISSLYSGCNVTINYSPAGQTGGLGNTVLFTCNSSAPSATYQWQIQVGGGFQNLSNSGQYSGANTDSLKVSNLSMQNNLEKYRCVISSNGCSNATTVAYLIVNNNVGVIEIEKEEKSFTIFPNPFNLRSSLVLKTKLQNAEFSIYNSLGQIVKTINSISGFTINIERENFSAGIYYFEVKEEGKNKVSGKLVVSD